MNAETATLTLHSTWRGIVSSFVGSGLVLGLGLLAWGANGARFVPVAITVTGVVIVAGMLLDYPVASTFDAEGVTRRAALRRHRLPWSSVKQLSRARPSILAIRKKAVQGGLIAVVGSRRYLLVDVVESGDEYDRLVRLLDDQDLGLDTLRRPADDVPPTWLYRRARWRPESAR